MGQRPSRPEREEAARREALGTLASLRRNNEGVAASAIERAARRATDHFSAKDAVVESQNDLVELWGRRIGRGLSLLAFVGLAIYLYVIYFAR